MDAIADPPQEPRNEAVSVAVTATEKQAVEAVASAKGMPKSEVLRRWSIEEVLGMYVRIQAAVADKIPA